MKRTGALGFGAELLLGGRGIDYGFNGTDASKTVGAGVIEPRVRLEYGRADAGWSLGATAGANVVSEGDYMAGVYVALHQKPGE
jgi:hypothetical protein